MKIQETLKMNLVAVYLIQVFKLVDGFRQDSVERPESRDSKHVGSVDYEWILSDTEDLVENKHGESEVVEQLRMHIESVSRFTAVYGNGPGCMLW